MHCLVWIDIGAKLLFMELSGNLLFSLPQNHLIFLSLFFIHIIWAFKICCSSLDKMERACPHSFLSLVLHPTDEQRHCLSSSPWSGTMGLLPGGQCLLTCQGRGLRWSNGGLSDKSEAMAEYWAAQQSLSKNWKFFSKEPTQSQKRRLSCWEHWLRFQRTWVQFSILTWQFTNKWYYSKEPNWRFLIVVLSTEIRSSNLWKVWLSMKWRRCQEP